MFVYDKNKDTPFCIGSIGVTSLAGVGGGIKHMTRSTKHLDISGTYRYVLFKFAVKRKNQIVYFLLFLVQLFPVRNAAVSL